MPNIAILWFRRDLRLADNPALASALRECQQVVPVYIDAPDEEAPWQPGAASRWWLHESLRALSGRIEARGSRLIIRRGHSLGVLRALIANTGATHCYWNRLYEPAAMARDRAIKQVLRGQGVHCQSHNAALLLEPWELKTAAGAPYRVFTAYWRRGLERLTDVPTPLTMPGHLPTLPDGIDGLPAAALDPNPPRGRRQGLREAWEPGEAAALHQTAAFARSGLDGYAGQRDLPALPGTSRLSPYLHFGEIGPRQVLAAIRATGRGGPDTEAFIRELGWREFSHQLLYHFPDTPDTPLDRRFEELPWGDDEATRGAWQHGQTGIPIVDAAMRELWQTGWMHNRARMIVASLLTKNLLQPWQAGARWFWDRLVDADLAANTQGWQWSAGCGADAAPYFRIFNPVRQGERFDPDGRYVRRWCPELERLPDSYIHQPWAAPAAVLQEAGIRLGLDYPRPLVDLKRSRAAALTAYDRIRDA